MSTRVIWGILGGLVIVLVAVLVIVQPTRAATNHVTLPTGYDIELILTDLNSPVSVAWDDGGRMHVATKGSEKEPGTVWRVDADTKTSVISGLKDISSIEFVGDVLYVAHENMVSAISGGKNEVLLSLSSPYVAHSIKAGPEGTLYVGAISSDDSSIVAVRPGEGESVAAWGITGPFSFGFLPGDVSLTVLLGENGAVTGQNIRRVTVPSDTPLHMAVAPEVFDPEGGIYVATPGKSLASGFFRRPAVKGGAEGSRVIKLDPDSQKAETFAQNKTDTITRGTAFRSLSEAKFGPDGCLYLVDQGIGEGKGGGTKPGTGLLWRICKQRLGYTNEALKGVRGLDQAGQASAGSGDPPPWEPNYKELQDRLRDHIEGLGQEWGLFFKDLTTGKSFGIGEDLPVPAASTVKVPVVLYASNLVSKGQLSWDERLTYSVDRDWRGGAGSLQFTAKDGDTFSIRELAEKAIVESDNIAWKMLERRLGIDNIVGFMWSLGGTVVYPGGQNISTARDMATYMEAALNFARQNPEGEKLVYDLSHTIWNTGLNRFIADQVEVGHKEGDITGVADDVGIVYAQKPYILSIMSKGHDDVERGFEEIGRISQIVYEYQTGQATPP